MGSIKLENVSKTFGEVSVIPSIDLEINNGEFAVFVGPSGCGKSTLLRLIAGLEDVSGGRILIDGVDATDKAPSQRGLAMVFQSYALYPHMSVRSNIGFPLKMAKVDPTEISRKVEEAAKILNLTDYLDRKPRNLSGGQRQRVAIGRAIVRSPECFLFDEPLSNLDAALRVQTRIEIARLHRDLGATMIYVTHDQVEAMTLADKIVVLRAGRVEQVGRPMDLYNDPDNTFVAGFIGSPQMNFLNAGRLGLSSDKLGIRPEHLGLDHGASAGTDRIPGRVSHVEKLGGETLVYVNTQDHGLLTVRMFGEHDFAVDGAVTLRIDPARGFHFDAEGRRNR